jgi:hypothetical protein
MSRTKPERNVMALVATIVARALMTLNSPVRLLMPTAPVMRSEPPRINPVMNSRIDQLHAVAFEREPELPGEFEPAPLPDTSPRARSRPRVGRRL